MSTLDNNRDVLRLVREATKDDTDRVAHSSKSLLLQLPIKLLDTILKHSLPEGWIDSKITINEALRLRAVCKDVNLRILHLIYSDSSVKPDKYGPTLLSWSAGRGYEPLVRLLLKMGPDINEKHDKGGTALHQAAGKGHKVVVLLLLEKGADINAKHRGEMALHRAAWGGYEPVVRLLLEKGADINAKTSYGNTPLHRAAIGYLYSLVPHTAAKSPEVTAVLKLLVDYSADIQAENCNGERAIERIFLVL